MSQDEAAVILAIVVAVPAILVLGVWCGARAVAWARKHRAEAASFGLATFIDDKLGSIRGALSDGWEGVRTKLGDWVDSHEASDGGGDSSGGVDFGGYDGGGGGEGE